MVYNASSDTIRLYVRMEGFSPFALIIDGEMTDDALERAARHSAQDRFGASCEKSHALVRRIVFAGNDQLMDFARVQHCAASHDIPPAALPAASTNIAFVGLTPERAASCTGAAVVRESFRALAGKSDNSAAAALFPAESPLSFAVFDRLVRLMTDPRGPYRELFARVVLLTYRQFAAPAELLERLMERYAVPPLPPNRLALLDGLAHKELCRDTQRAVFAVLELWVAHYYYDFADEELYRRLREWARAAIDREGAPADLLWRMAHSDRTALHARDPPPLRGDTTHGKSFTTLFAQYDPQEIAAQLTILTADVHGRLTGPELLGRRLETGEATCAPNLLHCRALFARIQNVVTYTVVSERDAERRAQNLSVLISVCGELIKLRNWDMLVAVYGGLREPAVERLLRTWAALPSAAAEVSARVQKILHADGGYKTLKTLMREESEAQFPHIASFLPDLREIESSEVRREGLVNFDRLLQQYRLVHVLLSGRSVSVGHLVPKDELLGAFSCWRPVDPPDLMELSAKAE